jgi:hypothetical protein
MARVEANVIHPIVKTLFEHLPKPFVDVADANNTYYGYAPLGAGEDEEKWRLELHQTTGNVTKVLYAEGSMDFRFSWTDRASYAYSR